MTPERRAEIASLGGKAVPASKRSFSTNHKLAQSAGRKGGESIPPEKRSFSLDSDLASRAGRLGGLAVQQQKESSK
jgi:uncharacterized protein